MLFQHDNARSNTSKKTPEAITQHGWKVLPHPPYGPNSEPSEFHLFGPLKDAVYGRKFESDDDVVSAVRTRLCQEDK